MNDFIKNNVVLQDMKARQRKENMRNYLMVAIAVIVALMFVWYGVWFYNQPLDSQIEMRCRSGDSVACLSLPR